MYHHPQKWLLAFVVLFGLNFMAAAQSSPLDKKLDEARELLKDKKTAEAEKYIMRVLEKNPDFGEGWDLLVDIRYQQYNELKSNPDLFRDLNVVTTYKDENGKEIKVKNDTLGQKLANMVRKFSPEKIAYAKILYTQRKATLMSFDAVKASYQLRVMNVDPPVDTNVNKKALRYFQQAEEQFGDKNLGQAALLYKRAIEEQPDFFKASLYLGDCYFFTGNYPEAIVSFKQAVNRFPALLEPRKYLTDAYYKADMYDKALEEAKQTMLIYPDLSMLQKMTDAAYLTHHSYNIKPIHRPVFPNAIPDSTEDLDQDAYVGEKPLVATGPWLVYREAGKKIAPYCNKEGLIVKPTSMSTSKYMEVYSWEQMLEKSKDPSLDEARRMQQLNYLDCYVLISCFHYDLYPQYHDFVINNKEKVMAYFNSFIK